MFTTVAFLQLLILVAATIWFAWEPKPEAFIALLAAFITAFSTYFTMRHHNNPNENSHEIIPLQAVQPNRTPAVHYTVVIFDPNPLGSNKKKSTPGVN